MLVQAAPDASASFDQAWEPVKDRYSALFNFFGTLATVFPGTSTVESDFSILKDEHSKSTSDFSLEGKLHAKQYPELQTLPNGN